MNGVIGEILPLALGSGDQPGPDHRGDPDAALPEGKGTSVGFLVGWVLGIVVAVVVFTLLASVLPEDDADAVQADRRHDQDRPRRAPAAAGGQAVACARRRHRAGPAEVDAGHRLHDRRQGPRPRLPAVRGEPEEPADGRRRRCRDRLRRPDAGEPSSRSLVFTVIAASTVAVPVIAYLVAATGWPARLRRCARGSVHNNATVMAVLLLVIGVVLIGKGIGNSSWNTQPDDERATMTQTSTPSDDDIVNAYLYLFGRLLVARQEKYDIEVEQVGWNTIKHNPLGSAGVRQPQPRRDLSRGVDRRRPAARRHPQGPRGHRAVLHRAGHGRMGRGAGQRQRTQLTPPTPSHGRLRLAGSTPPIDDDALVIDLPGPKAKILARVELKDSPDEAVALQQQFTIQAPRGIDISGTAADHP